MTIKVRLSKFLAAAALGFGASTAAFAESEAVEELNELLKGELSAVETYNQALGKYKQSSSGELLATLQSEHVKTVNELSSEVRALGGVPATSSGAWGVWTKAVTGGAKMMGEAAALKALKEGEEHGADEYEEILDENDVPETFKKKVRDVYLPQTGEHIKRLDTQIAKLP